MRYIILLLMLSLAAAAADSTNAVTEFSKQICESYQKKDSEWVFRHTDTNGIPAEIVSAQQQLLKFLWGVGNLEVASVKVFQFGDYKPTAAPGEFQGRKLRFVGKPTHWIVLHAESAKAKPGEESASKTSVKLEFPVFQKGGRWWIAGATYAD